MGLELFFRCECGEQRHYTHPDFRGLLWDDDLGALRKLDCAPSQFFSLETSDGQDTEEYIGKTEIEQFTL